jgi:hypothetical protein
MKQAAEDEALTPGVVSQCIRQLEEVAAGPDRGRTVLPRRPNARYRGASRTDAALAQRCFDLKWLQRRHGSRALIVTSVGRRGLNDTFGLPLKIELLRN